MEKYCNLCKSSVYERCIYGDSVSKLDVLKENMDKESFLITMEGEAMTQSISSTVLWSY